MHDCNLPEEEKHVPRFFRYKFRNRHVAEVPHNGLAQTLIGRKKDEMGTTVLNQLKVVLGSLELDTQVYDSVRGSWETKRCRPNVHGDLHATTGCSACNGRVYITLEFSREILQYDFEIASWSLIDAPDGAVTSTQSQHYCNDTLGAWNGRNMDLVDDGDSFSLSLWELVDEWGVFNCMSMDLYKIWLRFMDAPGQARNGALLTIHASFCGDYVLEYSWVFKYERTKRFCLDNMAKTILAEVGC